MSSVKCVVCGKDIEVLDEYSDGYDLDGGATIEKSDSDVIIYGTYGSETMDMSIAHFVDYESYKKYSSLLEQEKQLHICDDCVNKLLNDNKISYVMEFYQDPLQIYNFREQREEMILKYPYFQGLNRFPKIQGKNIVRPIQKNIFAYRFNDENPEHIVEEMKKYHSFATGRYQIRYNEDSNTVEIIHNDSVVKIVKEDDVLVIHGDSNFEVLTEQEFNSRYSYVI